MRSFIAAVALQQLRDMEELQRDSRAARTRRRLRRERRELQGPAPVRKPSVLWTLPRQARRTLDVPASTKGAAGR
jgi:hypothetical protein